MSNKPSSLSITLEDTSLIQSKTTQLLFTIALYKNLGSNFISSLLLLSSPDESDIFLAPIRSEHSKFFCEKTYKCFAAFLDFISLLK